VIKLRLLLVTLLGAGAACSDPTSEPPPDGGVDATEVDAPIDAVPVDADLDAIDAPTPIDGPPTSCPTSDPPATPPGTPPTGTWRGTWSCVSECALPSQSPLTATTTLVVGAGQLTWRPPSGVAIVAPASTAGGCLVVAASETPCASGYSVCQSSISTTCGGNPCVYVQFASFLTAAGRWQVWEFRGVR
jgi:hypothetical protein